MFAPGPCESWWELKRFFLPFFLHTFGIIIYPSFEKKEMMVKEENWWQKEKSLNKTFFFLQERVLSFAWFYYLDDFLFNNMLMMMMGRWISSWRRVVWMKNFERLAHSTWHEKAPLCGIKMKITYSKSTFGLASLDILVDDNKEINHWENYTENFTSSVKVVVLRW